MKTFNKTDPTKIQSNDLMAIVHYIKVKHVNPGQYVFEGNDIDQPDNSIQVKGRELLERAFSADRFAEEKKINKTQAAELLVQSVNRPFTVCFEKGDGSERILRGRLIKPEPLLGRSMVEDLDEKHNRLRQVDHRTIKFIVVEGTKYTVREKVR